MRKTYEQPIINLIEVEIERGFAVSKYGTTLDSFYYDSSLPEDEEDDSFLK